MAYQHHRVTALACNGTWLASGGSEGTVGVTTSDNLCLYRYHGHEDVIRQISFSPTSTAVASASGDSSVQIWDIITGKCQRIYTGHKDLVEAASWSPDGKYIASCDQREMQVWETDTGKLCFYRSAPAAFSGVAWSADGRYLAASTYRGAVLVWDSTGSKLCEYSSGRRTILSMAWSPSGHYLAVGSDGFSGVSILALAEGHLREVTSYRGHAGATCALAWSPDGKCLASTCYEQLHVWSIGERWYPYTIDRLIHHCAIGCIAWIPFGVAFGDEFGAVGVHAFGPFLSQKVPQSLFFALRKDPDGAVHVCQPGKESVWSFRDEAAAQRWLAANDAILLETSTRRLDDTVTGTYRMQGPTITLPY